MIDGLPGLYQMDNYRSGKLMLRTLIVSAVVVLGGCGTSVKKVVPDALTSFTAVAQPSVLWSAKVGSGGKRSVVKFAPFVGETNVFAANAKGEVQAYDRASGRPLWKTDVDTALTAGVSGDDKYLYAGSGDGEVFCIEQSDGTIVWKATVSSEVISAPAAGIDYVVVRSIDGRVYALEKSSGKRRWFYTYNVPALSLHGNGRPLVVPDGVLIGLDDGRLVALRDADGQMLWQTRLGAAAGRSEIDRLSDLDADPVIDSNYIYAVNYQGAVAQIEPSRGRALWSADVSSAAGLGVSDSMVVVSDEVGTVWAFAKSDGKVLWKQEGLSHRRLTAPVSTDSNNIVVGDYQGYLHVLSAQDGSIIGRIKAAGSAITSRPVLRDNTLYTLGLSGKLAAVSLN